MKVGEFFQQGDVILKRVSGIKGNKLNHLTLAYGEKTGHSHFISEGDAQLYEKDGIIYLSVESEKATLRHNEHLPIDIPCGEYEIGIVQEYDHLTEETRNVAD